MNNANTDTTPFEMICETADSLETDPDRHVANVLNSSITAAVRAATATGKTAKVTLKVTIKPGAGNRVTAAATVDAVLPRQPVSAAQLFADGMGNLHGADPRQGNLLEMKSHRTTPKEN
jgi:hypothetical protein